MQAQIRRTLSKSRFPKHGKMLRMKDLISRMSREAEKMLLILLITSRIKYQHRKAIHLRFQM